MTTSASSEGSRGALECRNWPPGWVSLRYLRGDLASWERVTTLAAGIEDALGAPLAISAIYDRDYYCSEHVGEVVRTLSSRLRFAHVHQRKEIENYLLVPEALDRASARLVEERRGRDGFSSQDRPNISNLLLEITEPMRDYISSHIMARRAEYFKHTGRDMADINQETIAWFNQRWTDLPERLKIVPGKDVLRSLRGILQEKFGVLVD